MVYKDVISRDSENVLSMQIFSEVAEEISTCSNDLLVVAEAITQSCLMIGATGDDYREILSSRAKNFKMLAGLYKTKSRRFEGIVKKLAGDIQEDAALPENALVGNNC